MLIDTHCHLDANEFAADRDAIVQKALGTGVEKILVPAIEKANFAAVRDCSRRFRQCYPAYGIHPLYTDHTGEHDLSHLRNWLLDELPGPFPPVAIGEIGLDFFIPDFDAARQEYHFIEQLKIARDLNLPVLLHVRRAVDQVLKCLRRTGVCGGIAHAFNGSHQQAEEFIKLGFKLGFGGAMTYPRATRIRDLAATLPLDCIVLETDAPDIPPVWIANQRNSPQELMAIASVFAELRALSVAQVVGITGSNVLSLIPALKR